MQSFKANSIKSPQTPKQRLLRLSAHGGTLLAVGFLYALFCSQTQKSIPCLFHTLTGLKCPGCGISHMCLCLLHLDFPGAWKANCAVMTLLPLLICLAARLATRYVQNGSTRPNKTENVALYATSAALLLFGILRNLPLN